MKILVLANSDIGLYKFRKELLAELLSDGNEIVLSVPNGNLIQPLIDLGCSFIDTSVDRRGVNPTNDLKLLMNYFHIINEINPDLILTYTIKPNIYGGIAARMKKKPYIVNITGLGTAFENAGFVRSLVVMLYKYALKRAKVVFFENVGDREEFLSFKCCNRSQTHVLNGAGVNTTTFDYIPYPNNDIFHFLFIGRVMKEKGVEELFEAMRKIIHEQPCCLDVVGPFEEDYKDLLYEYESEGWLKYYGYQEDVRPYIARCNCFILPSYHEGMANTNLECASCGRPIITSDIPGCRESVLDGISGYVCEPKSVDSLYNAMKRMITNSNREAMGLAGRNHMKDVFEKKKVVSETIKIVFEE